MQLELPNVLIKTRVKLSIHEIITSIENPDAKLYKKGETFLFLMSDVIFYKKKIRHRFRNLNYDIQDVPIFL